jgi:subtilisin
MALLLLAVAAPAGFVFAADASRPYIVFFADDVVSTPAAATTALRRDVATNAGGPRRVDGHKVDRQVVALRSRFGIRPENVYASAVGGFSAYLKPAQVRALERNRAISAVIPDEEIQLEDIVAADGAAGSGVRTTANPRGRVPAGVRRVGAERSTMARVDGRDTRVNVDVAILDTGIERDHPDLNVAGGYNCTGRNRNKWDDDDGHGTHVAGIVGALDNRFGVVGVAPGARLWSVKVLNSKGRGLLSWMVCGVDWVTSQRDSGNDRSRIEVANMSISFGLGSRERDCGRDNRDNLHEAICRSVRRGTVYAVAAGNESRDARRNRPAAYDEVITVSAMADFDGRGGGRGSSRETCPFWTPESDDSFTTFSNYGPDVDLIAPGRCIISTWPHGKYAWLSGTSMAAPHVAGAAAVYRAMYPGATAQQTRLALVAVGTRDWRTQTDPDGRPEKAVWIGGFRTMPDFSMSAQSTASTADLTPGSELPLTITLDRTGGFDDEVVLEVVDAPVGVDATPVTTTDGSATLDVQFATEVAAGAYSITVRAVSGEIERTQVVLVSVSVDSTVTEVQLTQPGVLEFDAPSL